MRHVERVAIVRHFASGGTAADLPVSDAEHCANCHECALLVENAALAAVLSCLSIDLRGAVATERQEARALVEAMLDDEPAHRWPLIVRGDTRFHGAAAVSELLARCYAEYGRSPLRAFDLAETACKAADALVRTRETDFLRAMVWKQLATTLREIRHYAEASAALDKADGIASDLGDAYASAVMRYARAVLYIEPDVFRVDDALSLLDDDTLAVLAHHDAARHRGAIYSRAIAHYRASHYQDALTILSSLLADHGGVMPAEERADALSLASWCYRGAGGFDAALEFAEAAVSLAKVTAAVPRLAAARQLWARGEARLGLSDTDGATGQSLELDAREPDRRRHFTAEAMAYLREAARHRALTVGIVAEVRDYLGTLTKRPPSRFAPTASPFVM